MELRRHRLPQRTSQKRTPAETDGRRMSELEVGLGKVGLVGVWERAIGRPVGGDDPIPGPRPCASAP